MAETKITDLVPQETIDKVKELNTEIQDLLTTYTETAKDLAKGLNLEVKVIGDIDKLEKFYNEKVKEASELTNQLNSKIKEQQTVIANTTNTISRQLMERERLNKTIREEYSDGEKVRNLTKEIIDTYSEQTKRLAQLELQIKSNKKSQKELQDAYESGKISEEKYLEAQGKLIAKGRELNLWKSQLQQLMKVEEKMNDAQSGSYVQLSQQLELLKKTYKEMSEQQKNSDMGREFERSIQDLDAHLKDLSADMGEFQRNVGNYAIAGQNGVATTESVMAAMQQQAITTQDLVDQTKILEEAKARLNTQDERYGEVLAMLNSKIEENKTRLMDVSDIIDVEVKSVAQAEDQNKRLNEALKHIDVTSEGAKEQIDKLNAKIAENTRFIEQNLPAAEKEKKLLQEQAKAASEAEKANKGLADSVLNLIGVNSNFGSSLQSLGQQGSVYDGLKTKATAFLNTITGLLTNPWVLTFLGIAGVAAGFKWWYDYNKGLVEASKLTKNFTGLTGEAADKVTADMQAIADHAGKGFDDTISAANKLVQYFGVSWEEAMKLMEDGMIAGANMSDNMIANIERFTPAMKAAGVSAEEFMAILSETRNGIFDEKGIEAITKAGGRLRTMTKQTESALDAVGISAKKMQKDLEEGNITMFEAVQQVALKLKELPENSQEAGAIMKNVFSRTAAEGGTLLIQSIADVNTNLDECKENMGTLGEVTERQMKAQKELNEALVAVFKMSGTSFEEMIGTAKAFITEGLVQIIRKGADVYNWLVDLYNETVAFRLIVGGVIASFKVLYEVGKGLFNLMIEGWRGTAVGAKGLMEILSGDFKKGWETISVNAEKHFKNIGKIIVDTGKEIGKDFMDGIDDSINSRAEKINLDVDIPGGDNPLNQGGSLYMPEKNKELSDKEKRELEKSAKEQLKILQQLDESKIALIQNSHEKEMATIRLNYRKKLEAIKGEGENEKALRIQLLEQMEHDLSECERKYQEELSKTNLSNRLAAVKKGSKDELDIKMAMLEQSRQKEIEEAEKTGADITLIDEKYLSQRQKLKEDYVKAQVQLTMDQFGVEETLRNQQLQRDLIALQEKYSEDLRLAGNNAEKKKEIEKQYQRDVYDTQMKYAKESAQASIGMLQEILDNENLSAEERERIALQLADAQIQYDQLVADEHEEHTHKQEEDDEELKNKRISNIAQWLNVAKEAISAIADLANALYGSQIQKIEDLQEANQEAGDKEQDRISELVEKRVITEEEGEARKRAAEKKTAQENEKLEKKKAELQYKQAVWEKANSLAQAAIATALSLMQLWVQPGWPAAIPMMAMVGALGAIQMATISATPIPKYAKGTDYHIGGPAIVGDGGRPEVVMFNGGAWLTPDTPTLVDMPKGAVVLPDINDFDDGPTNLMIPLPVDKPNYKPYDDNGVKRLISELIYQKKLQIRQQHRDTYLTNYELFKNRI